MSLESFYANYFNQPVGYTVTETIIFAIIFVFAVYVIYRYLLKRLDINVNKKFILSLVPFILFGCILRSLGPGDANFFKGYWFDTPGIYLVVAGITLTALLVSIYLKRKTDGTYLGYMLTGGSLMCLLSLYYVAKVGFNNPTAFVLILSMVGGFSIVLYPILKFIPNYLSKTNYGILLSHILDGSSAFISVSFFGYTEKHVLPRFLFGIFGPWIMIPLKIGVVWSVLLFIDRNVEEEGFRNWLKIAILVLGLALGTRNLFTVSMGV